MKVTVGIISHKPGVMLERCLQSLVDIPAGIHFDLKVQISEGTNPQNWNRLWEKCTGDLVCMLEDDTAPLKPMWLKSLVQTMQDATDAGLVMPIETKDGTLADQGFVQWLNRTSEIPQSYGFCNLIRRDLPLRADESLTYFVDIDLARQVQECGARLICNGHVWMLHGDPAGGRLSNAENIRETQAKDMEYLHGKWGQRILKAA